MSINGLGLKPNIRAKRLQAKQMSDLSLGAIWSKRPSKKSKENYPSVLLGNFTDKEKRKPRFLYVTQEEIRINIVKFGIVGSKLCWNYMRENRGKISVVQTISNERMTSVKPRTFMSLMNHDYVKFMVCVM